MTTRAVADPAEIFRPDFPAEMRDRILTEARRHMADLAPKLAKMTFSQFPPELQTTANKKAVIQGAKSAVALETRSPQDLVGTIKILRAWIVKLELVDEDGGTRIRIAYRKG